MNAERKKASGRMTVANYISQQIDLSHKMQREIAEELGYQHANIITLIKQGKNKVPLNRTAQWAKALGIDPIHLFRVVMKEYHPQTWEAIEQVMGNYAVTNKELDIIRIIREVSGDHDMGPENDEERLELIGLIEKWKERRNKDVALAKTGELHHVK
jgi:hypothetical protein